MTPSLLILAQLPSPESAQAIGWLALSLVCLVGGINQVLRFTDRFKEHPPTYQVYATKTDHKELAEKMDTELGRERGARKEIHKEVAALQADISAIKNETAAQTRDINDLKRQVTDSNSRIDAVPQRTISLLRETQQIHLSK